MQACISWRASQGPPMRAIGVALGAGDRAPTAAGSSPRGAPETLAGEFRTEFRTLKN